MNAPAKGPKGAQRVPAFRTQLQCMLCSFPITLYLQCWCGISHAIPLGSKVFHHVVLHVWRWQRLVAVSVASMAEVGGPRKVCFQRGIVAWLWRAFKLLRQADGSCKSQSRWGGVEAAALPALAVPAAAERALPPLAATNVSTCSKSAKDRIHAGISPALRAEDAMCASSARCGRRCAAKKQHRTHRQVSGPASMRGAENAQLAACPPDVRDLLMRASALSHSFSSGQYTNMPHGRRTVAILASPFATDAVPSSAWHSR